MILALCTRKELIESENVLKTLIRLLGTGTEGLNPEVKADIICFILISNVCKLLNPIELQDDNRVGEDSPEALIMQSDLFSGGLEPHLYCIFEYDDLKLMLKGARLGQNMKLVQLIEDALAKKELNFESEVLTEQDRQLR